MRLRPALLAALAALLLVAGLAPGQASASDGANDVVEGESITTVLHPGWNMVGWVGPATPTSQLFEVLPQLQRVSAWDAREGAFLRASRDNYAQLPSLTPGMGLWLHVDGDATVEWTRLGKSDGAVARLQAGLNLVGVVADGAVTPPADAEARAWRWDPLRQDYEPYRFGDATLSGGEALWIDAAAPFNLWQPGTEPPPFTFLGDVRAEDKQAILGEYENMRRFFAEEFAAAIRGRIHYIGADLEAIRPLYFQLVGRGPPEGFCGQSAQGIRLVLARCGGRPGVTLDYDYVTELLLEVPGKGARWRGEPTLDPRGPGWLIVGTRQYALTSYREATPGREAQRGELETSAKRTTVPLSHFEVSENRDGTTNNTERALGFFAVEWLAERAGNPAVLNYFRLMRTSDDWRATFETAFGLSAEDFYEQFEGQRTETVPPLPHLTDDSEAPSLVFIGDIATDTAERLRTEFEEVRRFYAERFEAGATEFTLYIAADTESARREIPGRWSHLCWLRPLDGRVIAPLDQCSTSLALDQIYVAAMVGELAPLNQLRFTGVYVYTEESRGPNWLTAGLEDYARAAYRAHARGWDIADTWEWYARRARTTSYSLRDAATSTGGSVLALGYLAVDWLVERAGEPAVFEYYRLLPPSSSVEAAFERAFGRTLDEFYLEFDKYHARLRDSGQ